MPELAEDETPVAPEGEMPDTPEDEPAPARSRSRENRTDFILGVAVWVLLVAVLAGGAWFGWSVYQTRQLSKNATPAMRALRILEKAADDAPNSAAMRVRVGEAQAAAGLYDDAISSFNTALKLDKKHTGALLDLGIVALIKNDIAAAEGYFLKVIDLTSGAEFTDLDQRREQAYYYLGRLAVMQKRYEAALGYLKGALRIKDDASDTYLALGEAYKGIGEYDAAINNVQIGLSFDPNYPEGHFLLGQIQQAAGSEASAAVEFRRAVQLDENVPTFSEALAALGPASKRIQASRDALASGNEQVALEEATVAYAVDPKSIESVRLYAQMLDKSGQSVTALSIYREALKLAPQDTEIAAAIKRLEAAAKKKSAKKTVPKK